MQPKQRDILRKQLLKQIQSDPESVVDLIISLMVRIEKLEDQLNKNSNNSSNRLLKICPYDAYFLIFAKFLGFRRAPIGPG